MIIGNYSVAAELPLISNHCHLTQSLLSQASYGLLEETGMEKGEWRSFTKATGEQFVTIRGI